MELLFVVPLVVVVWLVYKTTSNRRWIKPKDVFPPKWKIILSQKVPFYNSLDPEETRMFDFKIQEFLLNYKVTGVDVEINIVDKLLVAASGIIPVFKFTDWRYTNLHEVIIYPDTFNLNYETEGPDRRILGMVGSGSMSGKMILSQKALHHGFAVDNDKRNTAIHEFIHLIDILDGTVDGIPKVLLDRPYILPWLNLIHEKMEAIYAEESDINKYGGTSKIEFFAVASEYFFEQPKLMASKHPELYDILEKIFKQNMDERDLKFERSKIGRNNPCPCQSGEKYKRCCGV